MRLAYAFVLLASTAYADDPPTLAPPGEKKLDSTAVDTRQGEDKTVKPRYALVAIETAAVLGLSAGLYYATPEKQKEDWALGWDTKSWNMKLTSLDAVRFDSNPFAINAFGHSSQAVLTYQAGRGNGLGLGTSALLEVAESIMWEYLVEFREYPSINDMIITSVTGPALGEPMWQVGDYFRSGPKSTLAEGLAAFFQPFDEIERRVNHRAWRESARPWHRFRLAAGTSMQAERTDADIRVDLEVASFDHSGIRSGWTPAGGWSRIAGGVRFGDGVGGVHIESRTSYAGYQSRGILRNTFIGFGTGITYENTNLGMERDQLAAYHLLGPQAEVHWRRSWLDLRWQGAAYADLAMVHALAIGDMPPIDPEPPYESPLTGHGYYFGLGGTAWTRVIAAIGDWHADVETHAHQIYSLDKRNQDRGEPDPPKNLVDERVYAQLALGYNVAPHVSVDGLVDFAWGKGTVGDNERSFAQQRYGLLLTLQH